VGELERLRWAKALATAGWLFVLAYVGYIMWQVRRAFQITEGSFEDGLWWQRVEQISFLSYPQNLMVLVPAAACAALGTVLVRPLVDHAVINLSQLTRVVAGLALVAIAIALLGIVGIFFRNPDSIGDLAAFVLRLGGIAIAGAVIRICLEAERTV
jgi:drug/metabolite transporter (DMT)-like permease